MEDSALRHNQNCRFSSSCRRLNSFSSSRSSSVFDAHAFFTQPELRRQRFHELRFRQRWIVQMHTVDAFGLRLNRRADDRRLAGSRFADKQRDPPFRLAMAYRRLLVLPDAPRSRRGIVGPG